MSSINRSQLIDGLRAIAVLAMIVYHFAWDLGFFNIVDPVLVNSGWWKTFAVSIGSSFLFLSGISFWLSSCKGIKFRKFFKRFLILFSAALIVSLGTYQANSNTFVFFGILHLLSACTLLGLLIYRLPSTLIIFIGLSVIVLKPYLISDFYEPKYLAWIGLYTGSTGSVDFYGFIPWSSAYILGLGFSKITFKIKEEGKWINNFLFSNSRKNSKLIKTFFWMGRNSLLIYLIHQPILIGLIYTYMKFFML